MYHFAVVNKLNFGPGLLLLLRIRSVHLEILGCALIPRDYESVVLTNAATFLRGLKLRGESRTQQVLLESKIKNGGNNVFLRDN